MNLITSNDALLAIRIIIAAVVFTVFCGLIVLAPEVRSAWILWREKRTIAKRKAIEAQRLADGLKWGLMAYPKESRRIPDRHIDSARRTGQFSIPDRMRDVKGVTR